MLFRNLTLFRFAPATANDLVSQGLSAFDDQGLRPCGPMEVFTRGFVPLLRYGDLSWLVNGCLVAVLGGEDKLLPPTVITDALQRKVRKITHDEGRAVGGRERKRLREDVLTELLPRAFVRSTRTTAYADLANGWFVIDTASHKQAETVVTCWREALGSFPAVPPAPEEGPRVLLTDWLANGTLPTGFALGDECELRDPATASGAIIRARRQDLDAEEVKEHLRGGKQVFKLGLVFDDRLSFELGGDLVVHKLRFLDVAMDALGDSHEDPEAEAAATFHMMTGEIRRLLERLAEVFAVARPEDVA